MIAPGDVTLNTTLVGLCELVWVCPTVTRSAFKFAIENPHIKVDMTDIQIFPNLGTKYHVEGTPKTVINEKTDFSGGITEDLFAQQLAAIQRTPTYYG